MGLPRTVTLVDVGQGRSLARRLPVARTFRQRLVGLLGRRTLPDGDGLLFPRCRAIHTRSAEVVTASELQADLAITGLAQEVLEAADELHGSLVTHQVDRLPSGCPGPRLVGPAP